MPPQYFTTSQAAKALHVTRFTILNWIKQGKIKAASTFGGHHRIPESCITSLLKQEKNIGHVIETKAGFHTVKPKVLQRTVFAASSLAAQKANISRIFKRSAYVSGQYIASLKDKVSHILT
ncbi:MAG: helix-turn-helix domain-containing protein [Candidatus Omnitrophica bacterium]|nr:helix-turn-helix domain-containing protein [Candidatus Omnitrophota bacterium]